MFVFLYFTKSFSPYSIPTTYSGETFLTLRLVMSRRLMSRAPARSVGDVLAKARELFDLSNVSFLATLSLPRPALIQSRY